MHQRRAHLRRLDSLLECRALPLQRAGGQGRSVANAQLRDLPILFLKVLLGQRIELCAVFLFDGGAIAVKLLDLVEPGDAIVDPGVGRLEAILGVCQRRARRGSRKPFLASVLCLSSFLSSSSSFFFFFFFFPSPSSFITQAIAHRQPSIATQLRYAPLALRQRWARPPRP